MWQNFMYALIIMGKGMAGIFVSILFIMGFIFLLGKLLSKKS